MAFPGSTITLAEGIAGSNLLVATFSTADNTLTAGDFFATVHWGDGNSTNATISSNGPGFDVVASYTYADEGNFTPAVDIGLNGVGVDTTVLDVANISDAPLSNGALSATGLVEGAAFSGALGSFQDGNPLATPSDFTANIDWGDGGTSLAVITQGSSGQFNLNANHTYADEGSYSVTVVVHDAGGSTINIGGTLAVADAPLGGNGLTIDAVAGALFNGQVANLSDGNPSGSASDFLASIDWGDGSNTLGTITTGGIGFQISGGHNYLTSGLYNITTQVNDIGGSTATLNGSANVSDPPVTSTPEPAAWLLTFAGLAALAWRRRR